MLDAKLVIVGGDELEQQYLLAMPTLIGRGSENDITLPHPLVSRKHCELYELDGVLWVKDLNSLNGTFVGRDRITDRELLPGELLTVGTVTFRAIYGDYDEHSVLDDTADHQDVSTVHGEADGGETIVGAPLGGLLRRGELNGEERSHASPEATTETVAGR